MGSCLGSCVSLEPCSTSSSSSCSSSGSTTQTQQQQHQTKQPFAAAAAAAAGLWRSRRATDELDAAELISNASERCQRRGLIYRILKFKRKPKCPQFIDKYWDQQHQQSQCQPNYAKLNSDSALADIQLQNLDVYKLLSSASCQRETELHSYTRVASSRASSSLDLEWEHEHEYAQLRQPQHSQQLQLQQQQQQLPHHQQQRLVVMPPRYASLDQLTTTTTASASASMAYQRQGVRQTMRLGAQRHGSFTRTSCCSSTQNSWSHISTPESLEWDIDAEQEQQRQLRLEDDNLDDETLKLLHQIEQLKNHVLQETGDGLSLGPMALHGMAAEEQCEGLQFRTTHFGGAELEAHIS